jgi:hypothetical protein
MRKATRRKHRPGLHPLDAITASQPFPQAELVRILLKVHTAFEHLSHGGDDVDQFDRLAAVLNVGMVRCEGIGQAGVDVFKAAQGALMDADALYGRHRRFGFTGPGLEAMREAIRLYDDILRASTPLQMAKAQVECMRRVRAGQFEQAVAWTAGMEAKPA